MASRCLAQALAVLVVTLAAATGCTSASSDRVSTPSRSSGPVSTPSDGNASGGACVVGAVGDVAGEDDYQTGAARTAELISSAKPQKVLALGDMEGYSRG